MAYPECCVVRASIALPPGRSRFWATCGVTFMFRHSATNSAVSYALSPPTVTCLVPGICSSITSAASRSAVPLASNTSVFTISPFVCLLEHGLEESFGYVPFEQPLAVLGEHGHIPNGVVHVQAHEPAEQQIVVELFHQQPFASHRVQRLQQKRPQQLLRRNRGASSFGVQLVEPWLQISQCLIAQGAQRTQWVVLRHSLLRADVAVD